MLSRLAAREISASHRGRTALHAASIDLSPGTVTALVGPNGSGKSTFLRSIARLHKADSGTLTVAHTSGDCDGFGLDRTEFARLLSLLPQTRPAASGITVRDLVGYGRHPHRKRFSGMSPDDSAAVTRAMELTGITQFASRPVDELSGGELQRVCFASCLAQDTSVLLLDEPTTFLDLRYQVELLELVRDLADNHRVAVGVVLHDLNQAAQLADSIVLLEDGVVRAAGTPDDVLTSDLLEEVYRIPIEVYIDTASGCVATRPLSRIVRSDNRKESEK